MRDGFIKVAAGTPKIKVGDCHHNAEAIFTIMREADEQGVRVLALPELCLTGATCGDLFLQNTLLKGAEEGLSTILAATKHLDLVAAVGMPVQDEWNGKLYNCAVLLHKGKILGAVPKVHLSREEKRWFSSVPHGESRAALCGDSVCVSARGVFRCSSLPELMLGVELGDDLFGQRIRKELIETGIDVSALPMTKQAKTSLAFVGLSDNGQRTFSFYRNPGADMLYSEDNITDDLFINNYALHFCSVSLVDCPMKQAHTKAIKTALKQNQIISFDPNVRLMLWDVHDKLKQVIWD